MQTDKRNRIEEMTDSALKQLAEAIAAGRSETLTRYLATMAKFYRYSFCNQLLIAIQAPTATHVAGFNAWKKFNRFVRKGEKGIMIVAPVTRKVRSDDKPQQNEAGASNEVRGVVNFRCTYVFDVLQTDGDPLPKFAEVSGDCGAYATKLDELIVGKGIQLTYADTLGGAFGASSGKHITILKGLEPSKDFSVKVHELAHEILHQNERKSETTKTVRETEAEAVAFIVCQALGLNCSTACSDYIQLYRGDTETLSESLRFIRDTASEILSDLSEERELRI